jgi:hypothetical protein
MAKQVCRELGISLEPARSQALRSKLNQLADRGWLRKPADGKFTTTPSPRRPTRGIQQGL